MIHAPNADVTKKLDVGAAGRVRGDEGHGAHRVDLLLNAIKPYAAWS
jgi:hypothetical protein